MDVFKTGKYPSLPNAQVLEEDIIRQPPDLCLGIIAAIMQQRFIHFLPKHGVVRIAEPFRDLRIIFFRNNVHVQQTIDRHQTAPDVPFVAHRVHSVMGRVFQPDVITLQKGAAKFDCIAQIAAGKTHCF